jgi:hypothetical protein
MIELKHLSNVTCFCHDRAETLVKCNLFLSWYSWNTCRIMTRTSYIQRVFQLYHDKNKLHSTSVSAISWQEQVTFDECFSYIMTRTSYIRLVFQLYHDKNKLHLTSVSAISWQEQVTFDECFSYIMTKTSYIRAETLVECSLFLS